MVISQLFPLGEGKEEPWTARKHQLKLDALPKSVTDESGDTTDRQTGIAWHLWKTAVTLAINRS